MQRIVTTAKLKKSTRRLVLLCGLGGLLLAAPSLAQTRDFGSGSALHRETSAATASSTTSPNPSPTSSPTPQQEPLGAAPLPPSMGEPLSPPMANDLGDPLTALIRMILVLAGVLLLAYLILHKGLGKLGAKLRQGRLIRVIDRVGLEPKKTLYLVEVGNRHVLLGSGEGGIRFLTELDPADTAEGFASKLSVETPSQPLGSDNGQGQAESPAKKLSPATGEADA